MANEVKSRDSIIPTPIFVITPSAGIFVASFVLGPSLGFLILIGGASLASAVLLLPWSWL